jgi:hypothetical protein
MKARCNSPNYKNTDRYLGRGITYDPKWESFSGFREDMEKTFVKGLTLDRIDNDGNYSKENCKWSNYEEQANNRSNNVFFVINGERKTLTQWSRVYGINRQTAFMRLSYGWPIERVLEKANHG